MLPCSKYENLQGVSSGRLEPTRYKIQGSKVKSADCTDGTVPTVDLSRLLGNSFSFNKEPGTIMNARPSPSASLPW